MLRILPFLCLLAAAPAWAQDTEIGELTVELNTTQAGADACTLSFMVINDTGSKIEKAVFETVLFGSTGAVQSMTLFDFGTLPQKRPRVRQFAVPNLACDDLSRILFNGASTCAAPDQGICDATLKPVSRIKTVEVLG
ncbi:MAG: hypothetical protein ABJN34_03160 [Litoreibacter sp.]|uniref:hypothetical protein n=1 Tax=Litoreibacter sp. TaxID=1969459 RepID=UPI003297C6B9